MTFNEIKKNSEINTYIEYADFYLEEVGYTEHAYNHLYRCVKVTEYILETLGYDEETIELGKIAAYMHDIGKLYIKPSGILKDNTRVAAGACVASTCGRYDPAAVVALYDVFGRFCAVCDKIPFGSDFAVFSGVSLSYIREYTQEFYRKYGGEGKW